MCIKGGEAMLQWFRAFKCFAMARGICRSLKYAQRKSILEAHNLGRISRNWTQTQTSSMRLCNLREIIIFFCEHTLTSTTIRLTSSGSWRLDCVICHAMINGNEESSNIFTVFPNIYRNSRRITVADSVKSS